MHLMLTVQRVFKTQDKKKKHGRYGISRQQNYKKIWHNQKMNV